jgi:hypothetical protein
LTSPRPVSDWYNSTISGARRILSPPLPTTLLGPPSYRWRWRGRASRQPRRRPRRRRGTWQAWWADQRLCPLRRGVRLPRSSHVGARPLHLAHIALGCLRTKQLNVSAVCSTGSLLNCIVLIDSATPHASLSLDAV